MTKFFKCILAFLFLNATLSGQDTLVFNQVKDFSNEYKLPLGQYPVQIITTKYLPLKAIIDGYNDTILNIRIYERKDTITKQKQKLLNEHQSQLKNNKFTKKQKDSLNNNLRFRISQIECSKPITLKISEIKSITINNLYIPEKRKLIKTVNTIGFICVIATLISPGTQSDYIIGATVGLTVAYFITKSIITSKKITFILPKFKIFKKQWKINRVIKRT